MAAHYHFDLDTPFRKLPQRVRNVVLFGSGDEDIEVTYQIQSGATRGKKNKKRSPFEGVIGSISRRWRETDIPNVREELGRYISSRPCSACKGARLSAAARSVKVGDKAIHQLNQLSLDELAGFFTHLQLDNMQQAIASRVVREISARINFLVNVGLDYLSLGRSANTLSGGESQRIRLASQVGSGLTGVTYVLDEPSIGLHQHDNSRLLETLMRLRDLHNTVIVVEHDEEAIRKADYVLDMGPGAVLPAVKWWLPVNPKKSSATVAL